MSLGLASRQRSLLNDMERFCDTALPERSIYAVLHRERDRLFPDELFSDLFSDKGRRSVPPSVVATVMVLQRLEGLSDRESVERYCFDTRWRYAAGVGSYDCGGWTSFAHTVLVDMRARLARSEDPRRIFEVTVEAAGAAGLVGEKRVLDSTPLYDAVATMDTITLIRSAIRGLLKVADAALEAEPRALCKSGDDYASAAKPQIDWHDKEARESLVDSRAKDGFALLACLDGEELDPLLKEAATLLATVLGQDLEETEDGIFKIARRVAKDRVISTVDPETRHGHKTSARGFDGYKGHVAIDPDSEIITNTVVSAGNAGDASAAEELIEDLLEESPEHGPLDAEPVVTEQAGTEQAGTAVGDEAPAPVHPTPSSEPEAAPRLAPATNANRDGAGGRRGKGAKGRPGAQQRRAARRSARGRVRAARRANHDTHRVEKPVGGRPADYGDAAYGTGPFLDRLARAGIASYAKTQPPVAPAGRFAKDRFSIDLDAERVTCPAGVTVAIRRNAEGDGLARFAEVCATCPLRAQCTTSEAGRTISVGRYEHRLADQRAIQQDPAWAAQYRATRPKVERKLGHLMSRKHGGRRARVRGRTKLDADFNLLAAAQNLARLSVLGLHTAAGGWRVAGA